MRGLAAILAKDVREHGVVAVGAFLLLMLVEAQILGAARFWGAPSLFAWTVAGIPQLVPVAALLAGSRLLVREREGPARAFLEGLPISAVVIWGAKLLAGLAAVLLLVCAQLAFAWGTAARTEIVPAAWVARLAAAYGVYAVAWWATAACVALLGRLRAVVWCLLALGAVSLPQAWPDVGWGWLAIAEAPPEDARWALPGDAMLQAAAWTALCVGLGAALITRRIRADGAGVGFVVLPAAVVVLLLLPAGTPDLGWPDTARVRAASPGLGPIAARVAAAIPAVEATGVEVPRIVLVDAGLSGDRLPAQLDGTTESVVIAVPPGVGAPVTAVLRLALLARYPTAAYRPDGWRVLGLPAALAGPDERAAVDACAARAEEPAGEWRELRSRWGEWVAAAVAGARIRAEGDLDRLEARTPRLGAGPVTGMGLLLGPWRGSGAHAAPEAWRRAADGAAGAAELGLRGEAAAPADPLPSSWRRHPSGVSLELDGSDESVPLPDDVEVEWGELAPRARTPARIERVGVLPDGSVPLAGSPTATWLVRLVRDEPALGCSVPGPWTELPP